MPLNSKTFDYADGMILPLVLEKGSSGWWLIYDSNPDPLKRFVTAIFGERDAKLIVDLVNANSDTAGRSP